MSNDDTAPAARAGWYPTPEGGQRYWDGARWLDLSAPPAPEPTASIEEHPAAAPEESDATAKRTAERKNTRVGWVVVIGAVLLIGGCSWLLGRNGSSSTGASAGAGSGSVMRQAYTACGAASPGMNIADGDATITIDTKGKEDATGATIEELACVLVALKTPTSVTAQIDATRALDGTQTATWDGIHATWRYHPDSGVNMVLTTNGS